MPLVNHAKREINAKVVFYGPGLAGKATNLNYVFRKLKPEHRGKLKCMNIMKDRMLFFDFMPAGPTGPEGFSVRFHLYTLTGETAYPSAWKMILKGVDGIVFVADSDPLRMDANQESIQQLRQYLSIHHKDIQDIPFVLQCNKRDLDTALSQEEIRSMLNISAPVLPAIATKGDRVLDSLFTIIKAVQKNLREEGIDIDRRTDQPVELTEIATETQADDKIVADESCITMVRHISDEFAVEFGVNVERLPGKVRLPVVVSCGNRKRRFSVTVSLSAEQVE